MKMRETIPYGYITASGKAMLDIHVDAYNATQIRINKFIEAGLPVPEYELYDSFARMAMYVNQ